MTKELKGPFGGCISTHGGAGYAPGSYKDGDDIICGACGTRIKNPTPTGWDANGNPKYGDAVRSKKPTF